MRVRLTRATARLRPGLAALRARLDSITRTAVRVLDLGGLIPLLILAFGLGSLADDSAVFWVILGSGLFVSYLFDLPRPKRPRA
jgi:hypothetical protein